jgi:hypothetical protein
VVERCDRAEYLLVHERRGQDRLGLYAHPGYGLGECRQRGFQRRRQARHAVAEHVDREEYLLVHERRGQDRLRLSAHAARPELEAGELIQIYEIDL